MTIPIYVIHLENNKYRKENIEEAKKKYNINMEIFNAVDGLNLNINNLVEKGLLDKYLKDEADKKRGSLGCFLSHNLLLQKIMNLDSKPSYALIFEDDFKILPEWNNLYNYLNNLPKEFDLLYLGYNNIFGEKINNYWYKAKPTTRQGLNSGAWCYIVNVKSIPKILKLSLPIRNTIYRDNFLRPHFGINLKTFFTTKKLVSHDNIYGSQRNNRDKYSMFHRKN